MREDRAILPIFHILADFEEIFPHKFTHSFMDSPCVLVSEIKCFQPHH